MLGASQHLAGAVRGAAMPRDPPPGLRVDLQVHVPEPSANDHGLRRVAGRNAVAVALKRDQCVVGDDTFGLVLGRERQLRQDEQRLAGGELTDRAPPTLAPVGDRDAPAVKVGLRLRRRGHRRRAPPRLGDVLDRLLDNTLALRPVRRAHRDGHAIVLRRGRCFRSEAVAALATAPQLLGDLAHRDALASAARARDAESVSGLPSPRALRSRAACPPNSISRVLA
jgi:hypothetical protein